MKYLWSSQPPSPRVDIESDDQVDTMQNADYAKITNHHIGAMLHRDWKMKSATYPRLRGGW